MDGCEIRSHHIDAMVETITFVGAYRGIVIPEFLRWCRISSLRSINQATSLSIGGVAGLIPH